MSPHTERSSDNIRIVALCGSLRDESYTRKSLKIALEGAEEMGAVTHLIDLREYNLVFPFQVPKEERPEDVNKLKNEVNEADGIILGSPEYHGSFSGIIKNAIDLMGFEEFEGKMVGLVGVGGGSLGAINALNGLRNIGRQLHAWVIPHQASIPNVSSHFDNGDLIEEDLRDRVKEVGRRVAKFAFLHTSEKIEDFMVEWEQAPSNPGG